MKNDMKTLMEGWRLFLVEGQADPKDPKNPELRFPKGKNSASKVDDLEEGHQDPDEPDPDREGDGDDDKQWDTP